MVNINAWDMTQEEREELWAANDKWWAKQEERKTAADRLVEWWDEMHEVEYSASCSVLCD